MRVSIDFIENSNKGAVFDYIRQSIKLFIFHSLEGKTMIDREAANFYALLIGIDYYLPQKLPDGRNYHSLAGCVRDITLIEEFLQIKLGMPSENILKLTASNQSILESPELPEQLPTYENMVAAFLKLLDVAQPKDQVYIHYSGHGGRTPTQFPELKGTNSFDESLVPTDTAIPAVMKYNSNN